MQKEQPHGFYNYPLNSHYRRFNFHHHWHGAGYSVGHIALGELSIVNVQLPIINELVSLIIDYCVLIIDNYLLLKPYISRHSGF